MHVPHDVDVRNDQLRMLRAKVKNEDLEEATQEQLGEALAAVQSEPIVQRQEEPKPVTIAEVKPVAVKQTSLVRDIPGGMAPPANPAPANGTVVLEVEGGPTVPSFLGKSLRAAIESAQRDGIELDVIGSGTAREQVPLPGARMPAGGRVAVKFSR
jgi:hypothetical protein